MISNFILWTSNNLSSIQELYNRLFSFMVGGFIGIAIYGIIKFIYDIFKLGFKKALKNFWKFIWRPLIGCLIGMFSWLIVALFFSLLSKILPFDTTITGETSPVLYTYTSMAAIYNLIFLIIGCILIEFSFKNKVICRTGIIICIIGIMFPLIAGILCMP